MELPAHSPPTPRDVLPHSEGLTLAACNDTDVQLMTARTFIFYAAPNQGIYASMKVVILSGGLGTRFSEESAFKPKPMIEIGGMPILWHIMKHYAAYGFDDFLICAGY